MTSLNDVLNDGDGILAKCHGVLREGDECSTQHLGFEVVRQTSGLCSSELRTVELQ